MPSSPLKLTVFLTKGVALQTWAENGTLEREVALYRRLQAEGLHINLVTYGDKTDLHYQDALPGIAILCNQWQLSLRRYREQLQRLHAWHLWRTHILRTNQSSGGEIALRVAKTYRKPLIGRCGFLWSLFFETVPPAVAAQYAMAGLLHEERVLLTQAQQVIVTTQAMFDAVQMRYRQDIANVQVIPNYMLTDIFKPNPAVTPVPKRLLFVGRLSHEKNLLNLLAAVRGLDVEIMLIGSGDQEPELRQYAADQHINAIFAGRVPNLELPSLYQQATAFVQVSFSEGNPKTLLEAMACGVPVVAADVPGIRQLVQHEATGLLCNTDADSIRAAVQRILADAPLRTRLGQQARDYILKGYALETIVALEMAVLEKMARHGQL
jgi:glycosyltransferase involved in cell wall biosynthesis